MWALTGNILASQASRTCSNTWPSKALTRSSTKDWPAEKVALAKVEATYAAYDRERRREFGRDEQKVAELKKAWEDAMAEAQTM